MKLFTVITSAFSIGVVVVLPQIEACKAGVLRSKKKAVERPFILHTDVWNDDIGAIALLRAFGNDPSAIQTVHGMSLPLCAEEELVDTLLPDQEYNTQVFGVSETNLNSFLWADTEDWPSYYERGVVYAATSTCSTPDTPEKCGKMAWRTAYTDAATIFNAWTNETLMDKSMFNYTGFEATDLSYENADILALTPMTELSQLITNAKSFVPNRHSSLTAMAGFLNSYSNITRRKSPSTFDSLANMNKEYPVEVNVRSDPLALDNVLKNFLPNTVTIVPLNVAMDNALGFDNLNNGDKAKQQKRTEEKVSALKKIFLSSEIKDELKPLFNAIKTKKFDGSAATLDYDFIATACFLWTDLCEVESDVAFHVLINKEVVNISDSYGAYGYTATSLVPDIENTEPECSFSSEEPKGINQFPCECKLPNEFSDAKSEKVNVLCNKVRVVTDIKIDQLFENLKTLVKT